MSRILKRPMFRRGGKVNQGIMSGLVDRTQYSNGSRFDIGSVKQTSQDILDLINQISPPPKTRAPLGDIGLALVAGQSPIEALTQGYKKFVSDDDKRRALMAKREQTALSTAIGQALKTPKDTRTSLMKELEAAGLDPESEEYKKALKLRTLPAGTAQFSEFQTKANVDKATKAGNYAVESMDFMIDVAKLSVRSPEAFGLKGKFLGFGKDIATEIEGLSDSSLRSAADEGISAGVYDLVKNPDFTKIQPLENAMSIRLARTRNPQDRLMKDMIRDAKDDTSLSDLGGAAKVRDRLPTIFKEFLDTARNRLKSSGKTDEEIMAILNPRIQEFNNLMGQFAGVTDVEDKQLRIGGKGGKGKKFKLKLIDGVYQKVPLEQ